MTVNIEENGDNVFKFAGSFLARVSYKPIRLSLALALPLNFRPVARKVRRGAAPYSTLTTAARRAILALDRLYPK